MSEDGHDRGQQAALTEARVASKLGVTYFLESNMGDMGDIFNSFRDAKKELRRKYGQPCSMCVKLLPKANPSILLPGQRCRIHNYRDPRPESIIPPEE